MERFLIVDLKAMCYENVRYGDIFLFGEWCLIP